MERQFDTDYCLEQLDGFLAFGGGRASDFAHELAREYLDGKIDKDTMIERALARYCKE